MQLVPSALSDDPGRNRTKARCDSPMKMAPHFRPFNDSDLPDLQQMILALYREDPPGQKMSRQKIRCTTQELSSHPDKGTITIIHVGETAVGYTIVVYYWSNEYGGNIASIDEFYVKPSWRGKGIGTSFLEYFVSGNAGKLKGIQVEVTPVNEKALIYYSRNGFSPMANRHLFMKL